MPRFKLTAWDGKMDYFNKGIIEIGLWNECLKCCKEYDYPFTVINKELFPRDNNITFEEVKTFALDFFKDHKDKDGLDFTPYDHQIKAAYNILKHRYGLIEVATSGGKSLIFSIVFFYLLKKKPEIRTLLIVPSISLVTQFYDDVLDYNLGFNKENKNPLDIKIEEIMSDKPRKNRDGIQPNLYIGTWQSLLDWGTPEVSPGFFNQFEMVAIDESHQAKAKSLNTILTKTFGVAAYRFGMSGTYPNDGTSEMLSIESLTGPKLMTVKARELMDKGIISQLKIKILLLQYQDKEFAENIVTIRKSGGGKRAYDLEKEYTQNSEKRKIFIGKLVNKFKHNSLILFHNVDYGTQMYDYLRSNVLGKDFYYIDGDTPNKKRMFIKQEMEKTDGNPKILVASFGTSSTGLSIKAIKNMIFADSFKSDTRVRQSIGRALRLHKDKNDTNAVVFDLVDQFYPGYKTVFYNHYLVRRNEIYKKQDYPYDELKIAL
jgi:superfamily II DNA or RNA helicase